MLCLGLSWARREPALRVDARAGDVRLPLVGARLGVRVEQARWCTGHLAVSGAWKGRRPCPGDAAASTGRQCPSCADADVFRFAHTAHRTGYTPPALASYLAQPHWVYLATFADGTTKVGTAADSRRTERLDEQGPTVATFIARCRDGHTARVLEDAITAHAGLPQTMRAATKTRSHTSPVPFDQLRVRHAAATRAAGPLTGQVPGCEPVTAPWDPPRASRLLLHQQARALAYPHPLTSGEHGLVFDAVAGPVALARTGPDGPPVVVNLAELTGHRIQLGAFTSPPFEVQAPLF